MQLFFAVGETGASYLVLHSQRRAFSDRDRAVLDLLAHTSRSSGSDTAASPTLQLRLRPRLRFSALASRNPRPFASGMTNREIAAVLFIAPGTVREHLDKSLREARRPKSSAGCRRDRRSRAIRAHRRIAGP
jgi:hypothetical protein